MFVMNQYGHYFEFDTNLEADFKAFHGCQFFDTEEAMLQEVCKQQNLQMEEVEGSTLFVTEQQGAIFVINDRCDKDEVDTKLETFISEYQL